MRWAESGARSAGSEWGKVFEVGAAGSSGGIDYFTMAAVQSGVCGRRAVANHCRSESGGGERSSLRCSEYAVIFDEQTSHFNNPLDTG